MGDGMHEQAPDIILIHTLKQSQKYKYLNPSHAVKSSLSLRFYVSLAINFVCL